MQLTLISTDEADSSRTGCGRVWEGTTGNGTPVRVLICGMLPNSDDPAVVERFDAEYATLPEVEGAFELPGLVMRAAKIDLLEIVAMLLMSYGKDIGMEVPPGLTVEQFANDLRDAAVPDPRIEHLLRGADEVSRFIVGKVLNAPVVNSSVEIGNA